MKCVFGKNCRLGGFIRKGESRILVQDHAGPRAGHLACAVDMVRQLKQRLATRRLTWQQRQDIQEMVDKLERDITVLDLSASGRVVYPDPTPAPAPDDQPARPLSMRQRTPEQLAHLGCSSHLN